MTISDDGRLSPEERAELKANGIDCFDGIPIFPFVPDAVKEGRFYVIEAARL